MLSSRGQSILEYTMIVGILTIALYYMGTGIKRSVQSVVKVTADQVGNQSQADQDFGDTQQGYMVASNTESQDANGKETRQRGQGGAFLSNEIYNESTYTMTNTITNGGFVVSQ